jgi:hypothetical protein
MLNELQGERLTTSQAGYLHTYNITSQSRFFYALNPALDGGEVGKVIPKLSPVVLAH